jgi:hypothetical protein
MESRDFLRNLFSMEYGKIEERESEEYDQRVTWEYNSKVYNTEKLMIKWLDEEVKIFTLLRLPFLLVLDQASFLRTPPILEWFRSHCIAPCVVPSGCTSLIQRLDAAINKSFKLLLKWHPEALQIAKILEPGLSVPVTVKITSTQGSGRSAFCSATVPDVFLVPRQ